MSLSVALVADNFHLSLTLTLSEAKVTWRFFLLVIYKYSFFFSSFWGLLCCYRQLCLFYVTFFLFWCGGCWGWAWRLIVTYGSIWIFSIANCKPGCKFSNPNLTFFVSVTKISDQWNVDHTTTNGAVPLEAIVGSLVNFNHLVTSFDCHLLSSCHMFLSILPWLTCGQYSNVLRLGTLLLKFLGFDLLKTSDLE